VFGEVLVNAHEALHKLTALVDEHHWEANFIKGRLGIYKREYLRKIK